MVVWDQKFVFWAPKSSISSRALSEQSAPLCTSKMYFYGSLHLVSEVYIVVGVADDQQPSGDSAGECASLKRLFFSQFHQSVSFDSRFGINTTSRYLL